MVLLKKVWKDSATLIICGRNANNAIEHGSNYKILAMKRSSKARFMPNMIVFPGGTSETVDTKHNWMQFFNANGIDKCQLEGLRPEQAQRPFIYDRKHWVHQSSDNAAEVEDIERDVSLRITAIRETFEELGLLIGRRPPGEKGGADLIASSGFSALVPTENVAAWQKCVHDNANQFIELCETANVVPDVWSLYEWSNWLTPLLKTFKQRFNTAFYLVALQSQPEVLAEKSEVQEYLWASPAELLAMQEASQIQLPPPQIYEITRLSQVSDIDSLVQFAKNRGKLGMTLFYNVHLVLKDGHTLLYPGDDAFPTEPDFVGKTHDPMQYSHLTLEEFRAQSKCLHRADYNEHSIRMWFNIDSPNGHLAPGVHPIRRSL